MDDFVSKIQINTWANYYKHDFAGHDNIPAKRVEQFMSQNMIDLQYVTGNQFKI